jgi:hypothetical protein
MADYIYSTKNYKKLLLVDETTDQRFIRKYISGLNRSGFERYNNKTNRVDTIEYEIFEDLEDKEYLWEVRDEEVSSGSGSDKWVIVNQKLRTELIAYIRYKTDSKGKRVNLDDIVSKEAFSPEKNGVDDFPNDIFGYIENVYEENDDNGDFYYEDFLSNRSKTLLTVKDVLKIKKGAEIYVLQPQHYGILLLTKDDFMFSDMDEPLGYFGVH